MALDILSRRRASPVKVLSTIWLFVPLFCILVFLFTRSTPSPDQRLGPENKSTVHNVNWTNSIPASKTAYVYTHFGTSRFDASSRFIAILTSVEALRRTNTNRDIVVIVDTNTNQDQIKLLRDHGAIPHFVADQDNFTNPRTTKSIKPIGKFCASNFAPLYAWSLDQYERVIWLDADVLVQMNMDQFFLCGEFCLTYSNLQWYIASVMVLKPSKATFKGLMASLQSVPLVRDQLAQVDMSFFPQVGMCQTSFERFILQAFYQIESAPLFDPESPTGQQSIPLMRLNMGTVMNPIFWYEKYSWDLSRGPSYANMTSNSPFNIPAHSIGYPQVKPYDWFQCVYWNTNWVWAHWRIVLLQESFFSFVVSMIAIVLAILGISLLALNLLMRGLASASPGSDSSVATTSSAPNPSSPNWSQQLYKSLMTQIRVHRHRSTLYRIFLMVDAISSFIGLQTTSLLFGSLAVFLTGYSAYLMIPYHTMYSVAWPLFAIILSVFQYLTVVWFGTMFYYAANGANAWSRCSSIIDKQTTLANKPSSRGANSQQCAQMGCPYTKPEWDDILETTVHFQSNPDLTIMANLDLSTGTLSPLVQKVLIDKILDIKAIIMNIIIIASVYLLHQFQIFPHFAVKIVSIFACFVFCFATFVKPYISIFLLFNYAKAKPRPYVT